ncbi:hypothetical protein PR202_ga24215 [Eleusine coracana subsp. coracana]|uniref:Receptor-like serine/threonine-protein kinase n=1 Tax=Eleusine coracana subsp. coracana TaxID=191504 RepID=A0AAV5D7U7_ELECO|nr:hypothetical protein QOZ80_1BG0049850 [Eleusine coracana subsp. coracana]GJN06485.1 hypothetical protein PR202_ga24215 [Eleusine coracana subsp. coracana]
MEKANSWRSLFSSSFGLLLSSLICLVYPCFKFTCATDTLLPGQFLDEEQSLVSKNGAFKLSFNCSPPYYSPCSLDILFVKASSSCYHDYFPVWQLDLYFYTRPNLSISENGVLTVGSYYSYWPSPEMRTTSISAVAVLLDSGNFVIKDKRNSSIVIWQTFDNPTSILLPGGILGFNTVTSENITLTARSKSFNIWYTLALDATRRRGFTIQQNPGGQMFAGTFPKWMDILQDGDYALTFNEAHIYMHLSSSAIVSFSKLGECDSVLWSAPESLCDFDSYCGPYSICTIPGSCICPFGFDLLSSASWTGAGCYRKVPVKCGSNSTEPDVTFYPIDGIHKYPQKAWPSKAVSMRECESTCLRDCTCTAFAYNTTCLLWFSELWNTVVVESGSNDNRIYIRLATKQHDSSSKAAPSFSLGKKGIVISIIGVLTLIVAGPIVLCKCRRLFKARIVNEHGNLVVFSFAQIKNLTKNFSDKLGEGGFGCVFKGTIPVSTTVAVKMLKGFGQGDKQFRAEVQTIGMIQHSNLVRLLGFCYDERRKFLVYEYMVHGSLNSHLFCDGSEILSWELRYHVAFGTARGLAYLHEECKDCIVHCDIKPDNILLDEQFCPKIADFGMAKLLGRDFSRVLTTMRGTRGYLAPEWISGLPITHKTDVYSYGMMLLEIISGRRNSEKIKEGKHTYFPIYAAFKVNEGDILCLLDSTLKGNADADQLDRMCRVACWCIQDAEDHRPMMGQVVRMLEGVLDVEVPPIPRLLQNFVGMEDSYSADLDSF